MINNIINVFQLCIDVPFLDVFVDNSNNNLLTSVYHKPTDYGTCLNYDSQCPDKYKISVINNYLNRAYKVSSSWLDIHSEITHIKQTLINNNYPNYLIDYNINKFLSNKLDTAENQTTVINKIPIYFKSQMHHNYKLEERIIKNIITDNIKCISPTDQLNLIFYYNNNKSRNLIMKNNPASTPNKSNQANIVYCFTCPFPHHLPEKYIGKTQKTLAKRMQSHTYNGSIKDHLNTHHNTKPTLDMLLNNTTILTSENDSYRLTIKESLLILHLAPAINRQFNNFDHTLKLKPNRDISCLNIRLSQINNGQQQPKPNDPPVNDSYISPSLTQPLQSSITNIEVVASSSPVVPVHASSMALFGQVDAMTDISITTLSPLTPQPFINVTPPPNPTANFIDNNIFTSHNVSPNIESRINALINTHRPPNPNTNTNQTPRRLRPRKSHFKYTQ